MSDRGGVRSSARLSGESGAAMAAPNAARTAPQGRGRPVSTTAAAAQRRARAAERAAEVEDSPRVLRDKCRRLARALRNAKHLVVSRDRRVLICLTVDLRLRQITRQSFPLIQ
ncbi:hypothetical protein HF086_006817 [Spodoptera exigua]|uniref:Uncharacterized protein n=1 Tax=Spodoptera exigua TaxID=7107 RepID=A0A922S7V5_SPOEX|nr:hypothetical protein HF086_006817 [Spodoptera exigua]